MDSGITTVLAAAIAVLGTLSSSILTQRISAHSKLKENELTQLEREKEYQREKKQRDFIERRVAYAMLNTEMRKFRRELNNYLNLIRAGTATDDALAVLDNTRRSYAENYADAQMIVPDEVFVAARQANRGLLDVYGMSRRLDGSMPAMIKEESLAHDEVTVDSAFASLEQALQHIGFVRELMRSDLGITSANNG